MVHRPHPLQLLLAGIALDLAVIAAVTLLGALRVIPGEAVVGLLGTVLGARAMRGMGGGGGGSASPGASLPPPPIVPTIVPASPGENRPAARSRLSEYSTIAALMLLIAGWLLPHDTGGPA